MFSERIIELSAIVEIEFGNLNNVQLNWSPAAHEWSIGQCLSHIINSNDKYLPSLNRIAKEVYKPTFWEKINPMTKYTGRQMIDTLGPVISKKYKAPLIFAPAKSINQDIVSDFKKIVEEISQLFQQIEQGENSEKIVTSPVASLITLKIYDVMKIILVHTERHIQQALRVKNSETFPV